MTAVATVNAIELLALALCAVSFAYCPRGCATRHAVLSGAWAFDLAVTTTRADPWGALIALVGAVFFAWRASAAIRARNTPQNGAKR